jgi:acyl-CoA thioesterase-2
MSAQGASPSAPVAELLGHLDLERIDDAIFRGHGPDYGFPRVYGGLVVAQSLVAAERTVEGRAPHSLHCYFLIGGDVKAPIIYQVERLRDGGSFSTRRVTAIQHGQPIFSMAASFHAPEDGYDHATPMPDAPDPETLPDQNELADRFAALLPKQLLAYMKRPRPIELRPTDISRYLGQPQPQAKQAAWMRAKAALPDDPVVHRAVLAYLSDMLLIDTALAPHRTSVFSSKMQVASLDHAIWFHRPFRADEWLLYSQDSPSASGALGFARGMIHDRAGRLVASFAQEGLIRRRDPDRAPALTPVDGA